MQIILASSSPRRTQILNEAHINHIIIPSKCEEIINKDDLPYQVVESLSYQKAYDVYKDNKSSLVIGADTIVVVDDVILGKPIDKEDAIKMLQMISNRTHKVITGVTIIYQDKIKTFHEITYVYVNKLSNNQIEEYIQNENVYDKAGAYAIQGIFKQHISKYDGEYNNVVGLPIERLKKELKEFTNEIQ